MLLLGWLVVVCGALCSFGPSLFVIMVYISREYTGYVVPNRKATRGCGVCHWLAVGQRVRPAKEKTGTLGLYYASTQVPKYWVPCGYFTM